ncbi:hypothetical protein [Blastococcus sp. PRF04-17]|uniref:hypothetical protein n=1 Tax=Blastococcus sp. PRF04-17 TaxID=2933797 RepID=UPI001FF640C0|nr:hypothetical protein [Blastococcus sp. PRF04-17]UOY02550.1 hypothetical protein MVA48_04005 [Blastococcus sp. PRF04-17]
MARPGRRRGLLPLLALAVLVGELVLAGGRPALAQGTRSQQLVAAIASAYGSGGTVAIAVAKQQRPIAGLPLRGYQTRRIAAGSGSADNGSVAGRPLPTASMVKLFVAEDVLHRARAGGSGSPPTTPLCCGR